MVVDKKLFSFFGHKILTELKKNVIDNQNKTIYESVRIGYFSNRVLMPDFKIKQDFDL